MKTRLIYLTGFILICILSCSKDDDEVKIGSCPHYLVVLSSDCNCTNNFCEDTYGVSEEEFNRVFELRNSSNEDCLYVTVINSRGNSVSGYLIDWSAFYLTGIC